MGDDDAATLAKPRAYRAAMAAGKQIVMLEPTSAARLFEQAASLASEESIERAWAEAMWGSAESLVGEFAAAEKHLGWSVARLAGTRTRGGSSRSRCSATSGSLSGVTSRKRGDTCVRPWTMHRRAGSR